MPEELRTVHRVVKALAADPRGFRASPKASEDLVNPDQGLSPAARSQRAAGPVPDQHEESSRPAAGGRPPYPNTRGSRATIELFKARADQRLSDEHQLEQATRALDNYRSARRQGAYTQQALYDSRDTTAAARLAFSRSFELQVDPEAVLPERERVRRATAARHAHFVELGRRGRQAQLRRRGEEKRS